MIDSISAVRHTISIGRVPEMTWKSKNSLGKDALNAVMSMPGAFDVEIQSETPEVAVISYVWRMLEPFSRTADHLAGLGLRRIDWL
jgi:hypothetical protein